jgi:hypothetical protein
MSITAIVICRKVLDTAGKIYANIIGELFVVEKLTLVQAKNWNPSMSQIARPLSPRTAPVWYRGHWSAILDNASSFNKYFFHCL